MTNQFQILPDAAFKDDSPLGTVERIKNILKEYGIEPQESWNEVTVPNCFSLRVTIPGTAFGTNGKGVTKEFALASAYGEFMERLQLGHISKENMQKGENAALETDRSEIAAMTDLLKDHKDWYTALAKQYQRHTGEEITEEQILNRFAKPDGTVDVTPYYNLTTGKKAYFPTALRRTLYTTNGCAAGNSSEETIVQALSEIVERHYKLRVIAEKPVLPVIPDEVLQAYPIAWNIISFMRSNGFRVTILDCSLGMRFPVVCVCVIDCSTGKYHTHFGAFPSFEIALQRTLTETLQGRTLSTICKYDSFCGKDENVFDLSYLMNELVRGTSEKTPEFFTNVSVGDYTPHAGFHSQTNRELLLECVEFFREQGCDILVRDFSCLGFPTYQVIVPGYSEVFPHRLSAKQDDQRYSAMAEATLRDPSKATIDKAMGLLMHLSQKAKRNISGTMSFQTNARLPVDLTPEQDNFWLNAALAHVNYTMGKLPTVLQCVNRLLQSRQKTDTEYLICLKRYLMLQQSKYDAAYIRQVLQIFHEELTINRLYTYLDSGKNPLTPIVLHCDLKCEETCPIRDVCYKQKTDELGRLINSKLELLDFNEFAAKMNALVKP